MGHADEAIKRLRERAAELDELARQLAGDEAEVLADRSETADDEHDPEGTTLTDEWQRIEVLRRSTKAERAQVAAALRRVDEGTYGFCEVCGREIPAARLEARPMATRCIDHAV